MKKITFLLLAILAISFSSCKDDEDEITDTTVIVTGVSLNTNTLSLALGGESTLTATISPANATNATITWTTSDASKATVNNGVVKGIAIGTATIIAQAGDKISMCTVTISNSPTNPIGTTGTVTDIDGNVYNTITIGTQTWMLENLKVSKYNDGTSIPNVTDATAWAALTTGAYCDYNNLVANGTKYGHLYNWYTVNTGKLAPTGWHVPTNAEWTTLQTYLIANGYNYDGSTTGNYIAKSLAAKTDWTASTTTGAIGKNLTLNNSTGFSALPGGYRIDAGSFGECGNFGGWWSTDGDSAGSAWTRGLLYSGARLFSDSYDLQCGFSVRCVRD